MVEDLGTGEYRARFCAAEAGSYAVSIRHKGQNIGGSPLCMLVTHAPIAADCSYVVQEGLERAVAGRRVRLLGPPACITTASHAAGESRRLSPVIFEWPLMVHMCLVHGSLWATCRHAPNDERVSQEREPQMGTAWLIGH